MCVSIYMCVYVCVCIYKVGGWYGTNTNPWLPEFPY